MPDIQISVVVPAYNEAELLPRCLKSLRNQDYSGQYEILVVDNGSQDDTATIARQHFAKLIYCSRKGVVFARETGADAASGNIVVQADADTAYPVNWLTRITNYFLQHPGTAALAGSYVYDNRPWWAPIEYFWRFLVNKSCRLISHNVPFISGANFAFRRQAYLSAGRYSEKSLYPDQWGIAHRLSGFGKIDYDRALRVTTSPRRIEKPIQVILFEIMANFAGIMKHFGRYLVTPRKTGIAKTRRSRAVWIAIALAVILCGVLVWGYAVPSSQVFGKVYYQAKPIGKAVALTFDDGPNEPYTSEILDILDSYGIKATFFAVGKNVEIYPDVAKRIIADGNVIGDHSYNHDANHPLTGYGAKDIDLAQAAMLDVLAVSPHLYRPPHGKKSPWELLALSSDKMVEVTWSVAANDQHVFAYFGKPTASLLAKEIEKQVKPGKIIMLHDGYGLEHGDTKSDADLTVETLPMLIENLQQQGYQFVTVPELLQKPAYN